MNLILILMLLLGRHRVADPGVPRAIYTLDDPFFEMTGFPELSNPAVHKYTIRIQSLGGNSARIQNGVLSLPVWRNRNHTWCRTQTLMVPVPSAPTTYTIDTSRYVSGDFIMIEDWRQLGWEGSVDGALVASHGTNTMAQPVHRDNIREVCTD